jgi:RING finger protein 113A
MSFKKRNTQGKSFRSRDEADESGPDSSSSVSLLPLSSHLGVSPSTSTSTSNSNLDKQPAANDAFIGEAVTTVFRSSRTAEVSRYDVATRTNEIDTAFDRDSRAMAERNIQVISEKKKGAAPSVTIEDASGITITASVYQGKGAYETFTGDKTVDSVGAKKMAGNQGPVRAPTFIRSTTFFDYKPDICKDYKDTGFCGYGDSCKFLHDRGDYKSGWQQEKEWEALQAKKRAKLESAISSLGKDVSEAGDELDEKDEFAILADEELPFACFVCRENFTIQKNPVITLCGHYFCGPCAMKPGVDKCQICQASTQGVFNKAVKLLKKLKAVEDLRNITNSSNDRSASTTSGGVKSGGAVNKVDSSSFKVKSKWVSDP